ncbi:MAG: tyrosine-type recombinase/integrase [Rhodospirillales bacterium]|nr:tyrosine-type recombinase/integrase [Rhodospirillales bacterium]
MLDFHAATPAEEVQDSTPPLTIATALRLVAGWQDLSAERRRDLSSALRTAARVAGLPPDNVVLTPAFLRERLIGQPITGFGVSTSRWRNILSGLRFVLRRCDVIDADDIERAPAWAALLGRLAALERAGLAKLAEYCSARGIAPEAVELATFQAFAGYLEARTLTSRPRKFVGEVRSRWNRCHRRLGDWPGQEIAPIANPKDYTLPETAFPAEFVRDLDSFAARLAASVLDNLFDDPPDHEDDAGEDGDGDGGEDGALTPLMKPLKASSIRTRRDHIRWAASALVASGYPIAQITSLATLVTPLDNAKTIIRYLYRRAGDKPSAAGMHVAEALRIIARHHAHLPAKAVEQIKRWAKPVKLSYPGMTENNHRAIEAVLAPEREAALLELPDALKAVARRMRPTDPKQAAGIFMRGLAIQFLTGIPLRLANLIGLRLDQHLQRPDPKHTRNSHVRIPPEEAKTPREIVMPVTREINDALAEWVADFRPAVAGQGCLYLFPGHDTGNRPITPQAMRDAIKATTARHLGVALSPHQFRHLAAQRLLAAHPGCWEAVRQLLGHASTETTRRHYAQEDTDAACEMLDEINRTHRKRPSHSKKATGTAIGRRAARSKPAAVKGPFHGR